MAKQFDPRISLLLQHPYMIAGWLLAYGITIIPCASFIYIIYLNLFGGKETRGKLLQELTEIMKAQKQEADGRTFILMHFEGYYNIT